MSAAMMMESCGAKWASKKSAQRWVLLQDKQMAIMEAAHVGDHENSNLLTAVQFLASSVESVECHGLENIILAKVQVIFGISALT